MVNKKKPIILMAEDDDDFYTLFKEAFKQLDSAGEIRRVEDGEALMDYLLRRGEYQNPDLSPAPGIIFLDLNMPKKNGLEALREIRSNPALRSIPVVMLTVSNNKSDVLLSYKLGVNSFVTKPYEFNRLVEVLKVFQQYWFETVELPGA